MNNGDLIICIVLLVLSIFAAGTILKRKKHGGCPCGGNCGCCGGHCHKHR